MVWMQIGKLAVVCLSANVLEVLCYPLSYTVKSCPVCLLFDGGRRAWPSDIWSPHWPRLGEWNSMSLEWYFPACCGCPLKMPVVFHIHPTAQFCLWGFLVACSGHPGCMLLSVVQSTMYVCSPLYTLNLLNPGRYHLRVYSDLSHLWELSYIWDTCRAILSRCAQAVTAVLLSSNCIS